MAYPERPKVLTYSWGSWCAIAAKPIWSSVKNSAYGQICVGHTGLLASVSRANTFSLIPFGLDFCLLMALKVAWLGSIPNGAGTML